MINTYDTQRQIKTKQMCAGRKFLLSDIIGEATTEAYTMK